MYMTAIIGEIEIGMQPQNVRYDASVFVHKIQQLENPHDVRQCIIKQLTNLAEEDKIYYPDVPMEEYRKYCSEKM